jgi:hypothetical protein
MIVGQVISFIAIWIGTDLYRLASLFYFILVFLFRHAFSQDF